MRRPTSVFPKLPVMIVALLFIATCLVGLSQTVTAQSNGAQGITISPASTQVTVKPGSAVTDKFEIINSGDEAYIVNVSVAPYRVQGIDYEPRFTQLPGVTEAASWVSMTDDSAELRARDTISVDYTVSVPETIAPGGYYVVLFAETSPLSSSATGGVIPHNRVGNILYITVEGEVETAGELKQEPTAPFVLSTGLPLGVRITNSGGVHFVSEITFSINGITGKTLHQETLERYVLPQTERRILTSWEPSAPIGFYTIKTSGVVAGETQTLPDQVVFFVTPWLLAALFLLIAVIGIVLSARVYTRKHQKRTKQDGSK